MKSLEIVGCEVYEAVVHKLADMTALTVMYLHLYNILCIIKIIVYKKQY